MISEESDGGRRRLSRRAAADSSGGGGSSSGDAGRMEDPFFFHFHLLVQTIKIKMADNMAGSSASTDLLNVLRTEDLYSEALRECVPFPDWLSFIKGRITRLYCAAMVDQQSASTRPRPRAGVGGGATLDSWSAVGRQLAGTYTR